MNDDFLRAMFENIRPFVLGTPTWETMADMQDLYCAADNI